MTASGRSAITSHNICSNLFDIFFSFKLQVLSIKINMLYEEIVGQSANCQTKNLKINCKPFRQSRFLRFLFSLCFACLFFANFISIFCVCSSNFKQSIVSTFSSFELKENESYFYNLLFNENYENIIEFELPLNSPYNLLDIGVVFNVEKETNILSGVSGVVSTISGDSKKHIQLETTEHFIINFLNVDEVIVTVGDKVNSTTIIGSMKQDSKLYYFITNNKGIRQDIKIVKAKVQVIEEK
ncbi:MAG: hypothetical protein IJZ29_05425 [Clostridia bacterium]|nr:hypothetical protein [Clostridia bacterium]